MSSSRHSSRSIIEAAWNHIYPSKVSIRRLPEGHITPKKTCKFPSVPEETQASIGKIGNDLTYSSFHLKARQIIRYLPAANR